MSSSLSPSLIQNLRAQSSSLNLQNLQRYDPSIRSILHTSSHAVLYEFNFVTQQWDKTDCEGPFFIIQRYEQPFFQFYILNRKNPTNFHQSLYRAMELEQQENYLFYSIQGHPHTLGGQHAQAQAQADRDRDNNGGRDRVMGLWFYEKKEVKDVLESSRLLVKSLEEIESGKLNIEQFEWKRTNYAEENGGNYNSNGNNNANGSASKGKGGKGKQKTIELLDGSSASFASVAAGSGSKDKRPQLAVSTSKPLHSKAPPPPIDFQTGIETSNKNALESRLNSFLSQFNSVDEQFSQVHQQAVQVQRNPTAALKSESPIIQATASPASATPIATGSPTISAAAAPAPSSVPQFQQSAPAPVMTNAALIPPSAFSAVSQPPVMVQPPVGQPISYSSAPLPPSAFTAGAPAPAYPQPYPAAPAPYAAYPAPPSGFPTFGSIPPPTASQSKAAAIRAQLKAASKAEATPAPAAAAPPASGSSTPAPAAPPASSAAPASSESLHPLLSQLFASASATSSTPAPATQPVPTPAVVAAPNPAPPAAHSALAPSVSQLFQAAAQAQTQPAVGPPPVVPRPPPGLSKEQFRHYLLSLLNDPGYVEYSYWKYQSGQPIPF